MGVLHVVDLALAGDLVIAAFERLALAAQLLDVEVDAGRRGARGEEPARGVHADLGQKLVERDELAGTLGHRDLDAVADEADPRVEQHLDGVAVVAHRRRRRCAPGPPCRGGRRPRRR